jgi:hypothetical protein
VDESRDHVTRTSLVGYLSEPIMHVNDLAGQDGGQVAVGHSIGSGPLGIEREDDRERSQDNS